MKTHAPGAAAWLSWLVYPAVMMLCLAVHWWMLQSGSALQAATLTPVLLGAALVALLERLMPNDLNWQGRWEDVRQDLLFMLLIQVVLPRLLALLVVLAVVGSVSGHIAPAALWPHHWPLPLQAALMLATADLLRYWLHRLAHHNALLWRFHAVHHSPHKLYWLNVGRFHPVDKALQFMLDALPFILLGVSQEVISMYFVFYAVNGFFQHSNVHMQFGLLNYVISTAALHRWHHSRVPAESNSNYGNNLIVWDLLFGTRYLPRDREIHDLGLNNLHYPRAFIAQMLAPLTPALADRNVSLRGLRDTLINLLLRLRMKFIQWRYWRPLLRAVREPRRMQMAVLSDIIRSNRNTRYGREHGFTEIQDYADFCRQVPYNDYETLRPYIEAAGDDGLPALVEADISMYAVTSGTTAEPKLLPVTRRMLKDYQRNQAIFSLLQYQHRPAAFYGRYLGIVGGAVEGTTQSGTPYGSISGVLNGRMPRLAQYKYTTPAAIFELEDYQLKYYLVLRLALMHRNLSYIVCANPSTLLKLESLVNAGLESFIEEIAQGKLRALPPRDALTRELRRELAVLTRPRPERARELKALLGRLPKVRLQDLWPELEMVTTWKGGSCTIALRALEQSISPATALVDLGYLCSEFRGTFTYDHASGAGIPSLQDNFFEFVSVKERHAGVQHFLTLDQLAAGEEYYIFVTTRGGLYRYDMNDIVRAEKFLQRTPLLRFVQKGRGVTSITGEKLYENQVIKAVAAALQAAGMESSFYIMTADREAPGYCLYIESDGLSSAGVEKFARHVEQQLYRINLEYKAKRGSGRLAPLEVRLLQPGCNEHFRADCVHRGQKEGQFKVVALQYRDELLFDFDRCVL